ncbi:MAG: hypothetical protein EOO61_23485 [Hymenobacter sp.]|nr:MAG: hypothetical protein EOO61_23485 [Hymenobacter sp.]
MLSESAKSALEQEARTGETACFRTRCEVILLKAMGLTSEEVGKFTAMTDVSVNAEWEQETTKSVSLSTFKAFLKVLADDISE